MVADALVVPGDQGELYRSLHRDPARVVPQEDLLDELGLQPVEAVVEVVEGGGHALVAVDVGVDRQAEQPGGLLAHLGDEAAQTGRERHAEQSA